MTDPSAQAHSSGPSGPSGVVDEHAIRERVRDLTTQMLTSGRLDGEGIKEVVRALGAGVGLGPGAVPAIDHEHVREAFAANMTALDQALQRSAQTVHESLAAIAARGKDFSDNDLKSAFASLQQLQHDYVAVANRLADVSTGNLRHELVDLALHAQRVGADAGVRVAQVMSELSHNIAGTTRQRATSGLQTARDVGASMTLASSALLAGFADALREQADAKKSTPT